MATKKSTTKKTAAKKTTKTAAKKATAKKAAKKTTTKKVAKKTATKKASKKSTAAKTKKATNTGQKTLAFLHSDQEIAAKAYSIYLDRAANNLPGDSQSDWFQAIEQLQS